MRSFLCWQACSSDLAPSVHSVPSVGPTFRGCTSSERSLLALFSGLLSGDERPRHSDSTLCQAYCQGMVLSKMTRSLCFQAYCQGMSDLAAPLLIVMEDEVEAFW